MLDTLLFCLDLGHFFQTPQGFLSCGHISVTVDFSLAVILMEFLHYVIYASAEADSNLQ